MRPPRDGDIYFFVDENGDSTFYNRKGKLIVGEPGCSTHLTVGFIRVKHDANEMRKAIVQLHQDVVNDPYFQQLPSFADTSIAFPCKQGRAGGTVFGFSFDTLPELQGLFRYLTQRRTGVSRATPRENE